MMGRVQRHECEGKRDSKKNNGRKDFHFYISSSASIRCSIRR